MFYAPIYQTSVVIQFFVQYALWIWVLHSVLPSSVIYKKGYTTVYNYLSE